MYGAQSRYQQKIEATKLMHKRKDVLVLQKVIVNNLQVEAITTSILCWFYNEIRDQTLIL